MNLTQLKNKISNSILLDVMVILGSILMMYLAISEYNTLGDITDKVLLYNILAFLFVQRYNKKYVIEIDKVI